MASDIRPWYRWHWHSYRNSDRVLSFGQEAKPQTFDYVPRFSLAWHGAYRNLLDAMWERGGYLPTSRAALWRLALAACPEEYEAVADDVEAMFTRSEDGETFTHETLTNEWNSATERLEVWREAGGRGGRKRAANFKPALSHPQGSLKPALSHPQPSSSSSSSNKENNGVDFDLSEWCLKTCKAYPNWGNKDALEAPASLTGIYLATIERESKAHGGPIATSEWLLSVTKKYAESKPKFPLSLANFLRDGYTQVQLEPTVKGKTREQIHAEEQALEDKLKAEARARMEAARAK